MTDLANQLRKLMHAVGITSFKTLSDRAAISKTAIKNLRQNQAQRLSYQDLASLSHILQISIAEIIQDFSQLIPAKPPTRSTDQSIDQSQEQFQNQLQEQQTWRSQFQQETIQQLESLLLQLPTAAYAAQNNPHLPARNLLPLLRPLHDLLKAWGIEAIAPVGTEVEYDPRYHQLIESSDQETIKNIQSGDRVLIRYTGYHQGQKLLYRCRVSLVSNHS